MSELETKPKLVAKVIIELPTAEHAALKAMAKSRDTTLARLARHYIRLGMAADSQREHAELIAEFI
ncbi:hypothetical protein [Paraburkholderia terrae]|uniref:hypothetical protein n=1 Tax=Paraburkholderia terrae TaxID=311230 RepID=UPI00206D1D27|nr:hypothetical protein [Paraburkholderia terrae]BDC37900.1 hypothetical protein PTKU15_11970 [Paraburkholderia terrae]